MHGNSCTCLTAGRCVGLYPCLARCYFGTMAYLLMNRSSVAHKLCIFFKGNATLRCSSLSEPKICSHQETRIFLPKVSKNTGRHEFLKILALTVLINSFAPRIPPYLPINLRSTLWLRFGSWQSRNCASHESRRPINME